MKWAFWRRSDADGDAGSVARSRARESDGRDADGDAAAAIKVRARRRLIGAAALLLAAVVLVPMVLDPAPKPVADNIPIEIPSEKTPFSPRLPLPPDPAQVQSGPPPDASTPADGKAATDTAPAAKDAAKAAEPARAAAKAEQKAERSDDGQRARALLEGKADSAMKGDKAGGFLLQVAALGSEKAAAEMAARLKKEGLPAFVESVQVKDGARWRVRVGPFASRAAADKERARLREAGFSANLVAP